MTRRARICLFTLLFVIVGCFAVAVFVIARGERQARTVTIANLILQTIRDEAAARRFSGQALSAVELSELRFIHEDGRLIRRDRAGRLLDAWGRPFAVEVEWNGEWWDVRLVSAGADPVDPGDDMIAAARIPVAAEHSLDR